MCVCVRNIYNHVCLSLTFLFDYLDFLMDMIITTTGHLKTKVELCHAERMKREMYRLTTNNKCGSISKLTRYSCFSS